MTSARFPAFALGLCLTTATAAANTPLPATATLRDGNSLIRVFDSEQGQQRERRFVRDDVTLYRSRLQPDRGVWLWTVDVAHPYQIGRVRMRQGVAEGLAVDGRVLWSGTTQRALCLPEMLPEVAVAYDAQIRGGRFICMTPVPKAKKLAPLSIRRLGDGKDGRRRYEVGPGSLGMRFFMDSTVLELSADGKTLLAQRGQFEAARKEAKFRYLMGEAVYASPRAVGALPAAFRATEKPL